MVATPPAVLVVNKLVTGSIGAYGGSSAWAIFLDAMPDGPAFPDQAIGVFSSGGSSEAKLAIDFPRVQVRVRGAADGQVDALAKAMAIKDLLGGMDPATDEFRGAWLISDILTMGSDERSRPEYSLNFKLLLTPESTNRTQV